MIIIYIIEQQLDIIYFVRCSGTQAMGDTGNLHTWIHIFAHTHTHTHTHIAKYTFILPLIISNISGGLMNHSNECGP